MNPPDFLWMPRRATAAMLAAGHEWLRNSINLDGAEMYNAMVIAHEASAQEPAPDAVERVARAIFNAVWEATGREWPRWDDNDAPLAAKAEARRAARGAIAAMPPAEPASPALTRALDALGIAIAALAAEQQLGARGSGARVGVAMARILGLVPLAGIGR